MSNLALQIVVPGDVTIAGDFLVRRDQLVAAALAVQVTDVASAEDAAKTLKEISRLLKDSEDMRMKIQRPYMDATSLIRDAIKKELASLEDAKSRLQTAVSAFMDAQRKAEEAERRRREAEAAKAAQEAAAAAAKKREEEIEIFGEEVTVVVSAAPGPAVVPEPVYRTTVAGVATVETIDFELVDIKAVPAQFLQLDEKKIRAWITENRKTLLPAIAASPSKSVDYYGLAFTTKTSVRTK